MKIVKKIGVIAAVLLLAAGVQVAQADTTTNGPALKVAIVNVQQVLQQSPRVTALSKKLEGDFKARQTKINNDQQALQAELDKFKKESTTMSQRDRDAMSKKISADRATLVQQVVAYQQDLQKEQNKMMQSVLSDLNSIVSGIAKAQGFALVLDSQAVIFASGGSDITADVAKQFNAKS